MDKLSSVIARSSKGDDASWHLHGRIVSHLSASFREGRRTAGASMGEQLSGMEGIVPPLKNAVRNDTQMFFSVHNRR